MRTRLTALITLLLVCSATLMLSQNGNDLFQQGLAKERGEGDIQAAISIYERIVRDFASNRPLVAKTLVQLGGCYEKLGQSKAQEYYQQVVSKYTDQAESVAQARARLVTQSSATIEIKTPFTNDPWSFAISPDGRRLVFVATVDGKTSLWLRELNSEKQGPIPGTESRRYNNPATGANPFWSPDGRFIGYFEDQKLKTIPVEGGAPKTLANAPSNTGGTWNTTGDIVFGPGIWEPLFRVAADGGAPVAVTKLTQPVVAHRYPRFLADSRHFLYVGVSIDSLPLSVGSLDDSAPQPLAVQAGGAAFAPPDYLLFVSDGSLYAQRLDLQKLELTGPSVRVAERVANQPPWAGYNAFSVSAAGRIVAYRNDLSPRRRLSWRDRAGREGGTLIQGGSFLGVPRFSPDGRTVALFQDLHALLVDVQTGQSRRLDLGSGIAGFNSPIWSPRGDSIAFGRLLSATGFSDIYQRAVSGSTPERKRLVQTQQHKGPLDWHGDFLLMTTRADLVVQPLQGTGEPIPVAVSAAREAGGRFAPNGNWIAYESDELGGPNEVFVQPFPGTPESRRKVSVSGGDGAQWSADGRELYFLSPDNYLMVAPVVFSADRREIQVGQPERLFPNPLRAFSTYAPAPDGRFLISEPLEDAPPIFVLTNWQAKLSASSQTTSAPRTPATPATR